MEHKNILDKWIGKRYRETVALWYQCVAWAKKYYEERYGIKNLFFGGSAINAWNRKWNLDDYFNRVPTPQQGDMVFFDKTLTNEDGHVAIYHQTKEIAEQNWWAGTGTGLGVDAIRIAKTPTNILGYMRWKGTEDVDKRVNDFADKWGISGRSKDKPYSQYETLIILSKIL